VTGCVVTGLPVVGDCVGLDVEGENDGFDVVGDVEGETVGDVEGETVGEFVTGAEVGGNSQLQSRFLPLHPPVHKATLSQSWVSGPLVTFEYEHCQPFFMFGTALPNPKAASYTLQVLLN